MSIPPATFTCYDRTAGTPSLGSGRGATRRASAGWTVRSADRPREFPLKGVPPLTGDGYEFDGDVGSTDSAPQIDLPLHDQKPEPKEEPPLFQQTASAPGGGRGFAIGMLVIGLLAGFGAGFLVGQRLAPPPPPRAIEVPRPAPTEAAPGVSLDAPQAAPAPQAPVLPAQNFTETPVTEPPPVEVKAPEIKAPEIKEPVARPTATVNTPATLRFDSRPAGAIVFVDNVRAGVTPMTMSNVTPGAHAVRFELPGHSPWITSVTAEPGAQLFVGASLE